MYVCHMLLHIFTLCISHSVQTGKDNNGPPLKKYKPTTSTASGHLSSSDVHVC